MIKDFWADILKQNVPYENLLEYWLKDQSEDVIVKYLDKQLEIQLLAGELIKQQNVLTAPIFLKVKAVK